jgi:hypothetical protein
MRILGLEPTKNSGAGWIEKEDGQSEFVIAQLKSTDKDSMQIRLKDFTTLEYNATISHKIPIFVIQFIKDDDVYILARPADIPELAQLIETGVCSPNKLEFVPTQKRKQTKTKAESNLEARKQFYEEESKKWNRKSKQRS